MHSKNKRYFWEFFPKWGGHPISQNFCTITKSFLACQIHPKMLKHVFHTGGSNIWSILSIKVHLILSLSSSLREKTVCFGNFALEGGGGGVPLCWIQEPANSCDELCKLMAKKIRLGREDTLSTQRFDARRKMKGKWLTFSLYFSPQITWKWTMTARKTVTIFTKKCSNTVQMQTIIYLVIRSSYD